MSDAVVASAPSPKEDPETLVLRGRPQPVVRFRRGLIVGVTGAVAAVLVGLAWYALDPPSFQVTAPDRRDEPSRGGDPDALAQAPRTYGDVPKLGPPLPGDLGRPILEHRRAAGEVVTADALEPGQAEAERARAMAIEAERLRLAEARSSPLFGASLETRPAPSRAEPRAEASDAERDATAQKQPSTSGHRGAGVGGPILSPAPSPWTLSAGTIIPASLITGLNSDLPGLVLAQVTEHVRDSVTGREVLVPQGARLIGRYDSAIAYGQRRALLIWTRIVLPDGSSIRLDDMPATDAAGYAGVEDRVNAHGWALLKGIALSTLLGVGTQLSLGSSESDLVRAVRESAQQNAAQAGDRITSRNLDIAPTLTVRPGWPVRAIVNQDLVLQPWRG